MVAGFPEGGEGGMRERARGLGEAMRIFGLSQWMGPARGKEGTGDATAEALRGTTQSRRCEQNKEG